MLLGMSSPDCLQGLSITLGTTLLLLSPLYSVLSFSGHLETGPTGPSF